MIVFFTADCNQHTVLLLLVKLLVLNYLRNSFVLLFEIGSANFQSTKTPLNKAAAIILWAHTIFHYVITCTHTQNYILTMTL